MCVLPQVNPNQLSAIVAGTPDCKGPEGCLFCDKLKVHADEQDTRKTVELPLLPATDVAVGSQRGTIPDAFGSIFDRIHEILAEIDQREAGMVERIRRQVEEMGELDTYWASKLEMLIELEVV